MQDKRKALYNIFNNCCKLSIFLVVNKYISSLIRSCNVKCQTKQSLIKPLRSGCCHEENYNFNHIYTIGSECTMKLQNKSQGKSQELPRNHKKSPENLKEIPRNHKEISRNHQEIWEKSQEITRKSREITMSFIKDPNFHWSCTSKSSKTPHPCLPEWTRPPAKTRQNRLLQEYRLTERGRLTWQNMKFSAANFGAQTRNDNFFNS